MSTVAYIPIENNVIEIAKVDGEILLSIAVEADSIRTLANDYNLSVLLINYAAPINWSNNLSVAVT